MRRLKRAVALLRVAWIVVGLTLVGLVAVELGLRVCVRAPREVPHGELRLQAEPGATWARDYYDELDWVWSNSQWDEYALWRQRPYRGHYFQIDEQGRRRTINSTVERADNRVCIFGGSTVWGWSQREEHTIPSEIARALEAGGAPMFVENDGQVAYQSTQEAIAFLRELGSGRPPPRVAVFIDGFNEVEMALEQREAGLSIAHRQLEEDYQLRWRPSLLLGQLAQSTATWRALARHKPRFARPLDEAELERLADDVARRYVANVRAIEGLARAYRVRALFYWQPVFARKRHWSAYEESTRQPFGLLGSEGDYYRVVRDKIARALDGDPDFHAIDDLFLEESGTLYTDTVHYTEPAAARVARRIAADLPAVLR